MILDEVLHMLKELTLRTGYPIPMDKDEVYGWARGLELGSRGDTVLYTGALYQVMPYIDGLIGLFEKAERGSLYKRILSGARILARHPSLLGVALRADRRAKETSTKVLRSISLLLKEAGVKHSYLYQHDLYSGVLLYDLGLEEEFVEHAKRVYRAIRESKAKRVITVDPHTTHVLRRVYPRYLDSFDIEVLSYLEVIADRLDYVKGEKVDVTVHDPCFYARYEGIVEEPRRILESSGFNVVEPRRSRENTSCCGGPIESLFPLLSRRVAEDRLKELASVSRRVITLCPICYSNLSRVNDGSVVIKDLALAVAEKRGLVR